MMAPRDDSLPSRQAATSSNQPRPRLTHLYYSSRTGVPAAGPWRPAPLTPRSKPRSGCAPLRSPHESDAKAWLDPGSPHQRNQTVPCRRKKLGPGSSRVRGFRATCSWRSPTAENQGAPPPRNGRAALAGIAAGGLAHLHSPVGSRCRHLSNPTRLNRSGSAYALA